MYGITFLAIGSNIIDDELFIDMTGTLSRDPNSTLGRSGDTFKKQDLSLSPITSQTSVQSRSFVELKTDLSPVSEADESVVENETKIDLSLVEDGRVVANKEKEAKQTELNEWRNVHVSDKQKLVEEDLEKSEIKDTEKTTGDSKVLVNPTAVAGTPKMNKSDASAKLGASECKGDNEDAKPENREVNADSGTTDDSHSNTDAQESTKL